ncbi:hypothetical protein SCP_0212480 [Sparassis crispa]|uniref:Uncharacterized protein n=1 Tax=Sparassis crispa TaxID=139825 RepID=A0A401GCY5_9APHY|nr:hypothetical protein SCP_0212480 [Sparassis crispa]GBE80046.1 hypothetical protein SCP_0212480 [Sparassis crispa]
MGGDAIGFFSPATPPVAPPAVSSTVGKSDKLSRAPPLNQMNLLRCTPILYSNNGRFTPYDL